LIYRFSMKTKPKRKNHAGAILTSES
jgi:hypothetical protein